MNLDIVMILSMVVLFISWILILFFSLIFFKKDYFILLLLVPFAMLFPFFLGKTGFLNENVINIVIIFLFFILIVFSCKNLFSGIKNSYTPSIFVGILGFISFISNMFMMYCAMAFSSV